ncbi:uncharacterized protein N0V89_008698 [Didymosphaeria variabile]|uniref:Uncharacterized protein n=1 Tax=Didymosphaeria variabile TaxID=1932322 RepID=A0A9W9C9I8_9PLEO|nr:uncharacterized protein N0V89_008698 [Didymosphaeria variabile]KAJ4350077.1 hypothetical protein N0V89_008698 [Didymosphaeria variabile]
MGALHGRVTGHRDSTYHTASKNDKMARLRGGDDSHNPSGGFKGTWQPIADGLSIGVNACDSTRTTSSSGTLRGAAVGMAGNAFDFNSTQPLPWREEARRNDHYEPQPGSGPPRQTELQVRKFAGCHDRELSAYLNARNISIGFLFEIDQFLRSHPEIVTCATGQAMIQMMNSLSPLQAYRYFIKGYTRPARYNDGIIVAGNLTLPVGFSPVSLRNRHDSELDDFFEGFEYRWDILDKIDREVCFACVEIISGRTVPSGLRRLVCYAAWGNPVDAYKWFEYNYQEEYMPHRYLPEHVVLGDIPKPQDYTMPNPSGLSVSRTHMHVRYRMARANDEGVDVLDVLLSEYREALVKRGMRRNEIDESCTHAKDRLDAERIDIVDLVMQDVPSRSFTRRAAPRSRRYNIWTSAGGGIRIHMSRNMATRTRFVAPQISELRRARNNLHRLYTMEEDAFLSTTRPAEDVAAITYRRGCAERRYVNALIRYMRDANQMSSSEATHLQHYFTRQKMEGIGPINKGYLLGMYPRELN